MKIRELTKEQIETICNEVECSKCPFFAYNGDYYHCKKPELDRELPQYIIDIIKKD